MAALSAPFCHYSRPVCALVAIIKWLLSDARHAKVLLGER